MSTPTCGATKQDGTTCECVVGLCADCGHCIAHCSHRKGVRDAARSKGGRVTGVKREAKRQGAKAVAYMPPDPSTVPPPPKTATDARDYLAWLLDAGTTGAIGSALARDMSQVCERFLKAVAASDHEGRLAALEAAERKRREDR